MWGGAGYREVGDKLRAAIGFVWFGVDAFPTNWWSKAWCGGWEKRPGLENRSAGEEDDEIKECKAATRKDELPLMRGSAT
jgi:hypothetical protein